MFLRRICFYFAFSVLFLQCAHPQSAPSKLSLSSSEPIILYGNRDDAYGVAWETLIDMGVTPRFVDKEKGVVAGDFPMEGWGAGEEISIYFEDYEKGKMKLWVVSRSKLTSETLYEDPRLENIRIETKPTDGYRQQTIPEENSYI